MKPKLTYQQQMERLEQLVADIESGKFGLDELTDKVKEATELVKACKEKLRQTDAAIEQMLDEIA
ncbi:MAG: exodeoxyribonuclease VII small subunit [Paludibacteraceae bacterium]